MRERSGITGRSRPAPTPGVTVANPRAPKPQRVLRVESSVRLTPSLMRVHLSSEALHDFPETGFTDTYVKLMFLDEALGYEPPYDVAALRAELPAEQAPVVRSYTVRTVDRVAGTMSIDFVTHGDVGVGGPWAAQAAPGERLVVAGPGGGYAPAPDAPFHVLAGDLSSLPAIAASLEAMAENARGVAVIEVPDAAEILPIEHPRGVDVRWLVDARPERTELLSEALRALEWPAGTQFFVHGERGSVKSVRALLKERDVPRESLSISAYWARGRTEDAFQAEKKTPVGQID
jgi:NADPH-dependent ferric siderophore reductase